MTKGPEIVCGKSLDHLLLQYKWLKMMKLLGIVLQKRQRLKHDLSTVFEVTPSTIYRWTSGKVRPNKHIMLGVIHQLERIGF